MKEEVWLMFLTLSIPGLIIGFAIGLTVGIIVLIAGANGQYRKAREDAFESAMHLIREAYK